LNVLAAYQLIKTQTYFDGFETEVIVNDGQPLIRIQE
jgi:hypothetical protein